MKFLDLDCNAFFCFVFRSQAHLIISLTELRDVPVGRKDSLTTDRYPEENEKIKRDWNVVESMF